VSTDLLRTVRDFIKRRRPRSHSVCCRTPKTHVEQFLGTSYTKFANQLISQIDEAEITLLSPQLRREYDRQVDIFKKRRKKRQFDPTVVPSSIQMRGNRTVGEGSGIAKEYAGIVTVLVIAFFGWRQHRSGYRGEN